MNIELPDNSKQLINDILSKGLNEAINNKVELVVSEKRKCKRLWIELKAQPIGFIITCIIFVLLLPLFLFHCVNNLMIFV
jgi:hypothetical protein